MHRRCQSCDTQVIDNGCLSRTSAKRDRRHPPSKTFICRPLASVSVTGSPRRALNNLAPRNKEPPETVNKLSAPPPEAKRHRGIWENTKADMERGGSVPLLRLIAGQPTTLVNLPPLKQRGPTRQLGA